MALGISTLWAIYNCIGPYLLLHYTWLGRGRSLRLACIAAWTISLLIMVGTSAAVWLLAPPNYNYGKVGTTLAGVLKQGRLIVVV